MPGPCRRTVFVACLLLPSASAWAQSDPSNFTTVIDIPPAVIGDDESIGSDTQMNVSEGGSVGERFVAGVPAGDSTNIEVNLSGGSIGSNFFAGPGSTVNVHGGETDGLSAGVVRGWEVINTFTIDDIINGNTRGSEPSTINLYGGTAVRGPFATLGGTVNVYGGQIDEAIYASYGGTINIHDGALIEKEDYSRVSLDAREVGYINVTGGTVEGLTVVGGDLAINFGNQAILNLSGGSLEAVVVGIDSTANLSGGSVGVVLGGWFGSTINLSGGELPGEFGVTSGSTLNLFGTSFVVDGVALTDLQVGQAFVVPDPSVPVQAVLADGSLFDSGPEDRTLGSDSTLTLTLLSDADLPGDYNANGHVEQGDLDLVLQNWGVDTGLTGVPFFWFNDKPAGVIDQAELDQVLQHWGGVATPDFAGSGLPEPTVAGVACLLAFSGLRHRRPTR